MGNHRKLTTIPSDIQHYLLSLLPDFYDLGALVLTSRCFHDIYKSRRTFFLDEVARNLLGALFTDAILLARAQEATCHLGDRSAKGFSSDTVLLVINNNYIVRVLEGIVFGLLKEDNKRFDIYESESLARFVDVPFTYDPSPTEAIRFKAAAYRFWRFCLQPAKERAPFLKTFERNELLEMKHFVKGVSNLIYAMRGQPQESDGDWDFVASVLSTGPENIVNLWFALNEDDPLFEMALEEAGSNQEEGFFDYPLSDLTEENGLDNVPGISGLEPIFDGDNATMEELLSAHATPVQKHGEGVER
ncbi:hypothetical protein DFH09DRAFT_1269647 [Mycena vulgaris]|nr:hypothetical protein DFH09DRAFT_1269647 [Mycena vulgaris]